MFLFRQGIIRTCSAMMLFPYLVSGKGPRCGYRAGWIIFAIFLSLMYVPTTLNRVSGIALMFFVFVGRGIGQNLGVTSAIVIVSNSAVRSTRGWVMGANQSLGALSRALGTSLMPLIFAFSKYLDFFYLSYFFVSCFSLLFLLLSFLIPQALDNPRENFEKQPSPVELSDVTAEAVTSK